MDTSSNSDDPPGGPGRSSDPVGLGDRELVWLRRLTGRERLFRIICLVQIGVAAALAVTFSIAGDWTSLRAVLVILILLGARSQLRLARASRILRKLAPVQPRVGEEASES